jgi:hypothetical protein
MGEAVHVVRSERARQIGRQRLAQFGGERRGPALVVEHGDALLTLAHQQFLLIDLCGHRDWLHIDQEPRRGDGGAALATGATSCCKV